MTTRQRGVDRRTKRTRQTLQQAFKEVVHEKSRAATDIWSIERGLRAISVQDITERANVNRGTFYLHFADKYGLAEAVLREQFHLMAASVLPASAQWDRRTLRLLIEAILDSFEYKYRHQLRSSLVLAPLLERVTHEELTELLHSWLGGRESTASRGVVPPGTVANIVSWAIVGAALQWSQEETAVSKEEMTRAILQVVLDGTACLVPDGE